MALGYQSPVCYNILLHILQRGVDVNGPELHTIYPHGSTDSLPYVTMGSGSLAAMSVFEAKYKVGMDVSNFS